MDISMNCPLCHIESDENHLFSRRHRFNYLLQKWNCMRTSLVKNRHGIDISVTCEDIALKHNQKHGKHYYQITPKALFERGNTLEFKCTISNRTQNNMIYLTNNNILHNYSMFSIKDKILNNGSVIQLMPNSKHNMIVIFAQGNTIMSGRYSIPVCFSFQTSDKHVFHIARSINISVEEDLDEIPEIYKSPFTGNSWEHGVGLHPPTCYIPYCNNYTIPLEKRKILSYGLEEHPLLCGGDIKILEETLKQMSPGHITKKNYNHFWHNVLWLEEIGQTIGLQRYNMEEVALNLLEDDRLELVVPGLVEKRPSVIVGDFVDIRIHNDLHRGYQGIIRKVNDKSVEIDDVNRELIMIIEQNGRLSNDFDIRFVLSRLSFERQHSGVDQVTIKKLLPYIFPPPNPEVRRRTALRTVENKGFFDQSIVNNEEQKTAVRNILNRTSGPYPYIIFGPPGTGKTVTVVEAILQLKKKTTHSILVCAPSNAACDMLTEKLIVHCKQNELLRIMSSSVDISSVHEVVLPYSNYKTDKQYQSVNSAYLRNYRIIVTTLILIGKYTGYYHPDIVFIDEAAQASEPEVCIPLGMMESGSQIVLAGDPKQLGPQLVSKVSQKYGLGISLLERLMETDLYKNRNPNFITMLVNNFRNHSSILYLPNRHFYYGLLKPLSSRAEHDPISKIFVFKKIKEMGQKKSNKSNNKIDLEGKAVEFCSLISKESREGKSPSYFNVIELQMVIKYIKALTALKFEEECDKVALKDIGVVTPYIRQVHKLKVLLKENNLEGVEVGTTETFQGREKRIIIISTVRAQKDLLLYDKRYKLGFVKNKQRFNVAITRAMSKLIVIGCAHVLATDAHWLDYIEYCENIGGFCGAQFAKRDDDTINTITKMMENIDLDSQFKKNTGNSKT
ncbi:putative helicase mov-10-B.1 isoform X2 [Diorhabda sublineata]|uniref:putative helicase mov-10-B.1 isoform X2 n=1 Tax=Diorhabda sublineata TaxID=1163346 RepID=UPI0024E09A7E|nr:putative helicase mov-10-B.1 isoform X2 [Diorhabda sublineata]